MAEYHPHRRVQQDGDLNPEVAKRWIDANKDRQLGIMSYGESVVYRLTPEEYAEFIRRREANKKQTEKRRKAKEQQQEQQSNEKHLKAFAQAKATGERVALGTWMAPCDDPDEECNLDTVTKWALPDGTTTITRQHTW